MRYRDDWMVQSVQALLGAAVMKDYQTVSDLTTEIAAKRDVQGVWGLCCALAHMVTTFGLNTERGQGFTAVQMVGPLGTPIAPEDAPPESRPQMWATRFVAAYTNGDSDIRRDLAGKDLACWCPLVDAEGRPVPCHASVLLTIANTPAVVTVDLPGVSR